MAIKFYRQESSYEQHKTIRTYWSLLCWVTDAFIQVSLSHFIHLSRPLLSSIVHQTLLGRLTRWRLFCWDRWAWLLQKEWMVLPCASNLVFSCLQCTCTQVCECNWWGRGSSKSDIHPLLSSHLVNYIKLSQIRILCFRTCSQVTSYMCPFQCSNFTVK